MRFIFALSLLACSCPSTGESYPSQEPPPPAPCEDDAGAPDAPTPPVDLCGAPPDAPPCTACGSDGLGFALFGKCYYQCKNADHSCAPMQAANENCDPICLPPVFLFQQSCVPCVPSQAP